MTSINKVVQFSSMGSMVFSLLQTKLLSVRKGAPHPNLYSYQKSEGKRKQIIFFHTWNKLTATFSLTSCCKMSSVFSMERFFNNWLLISWFVANFGRPCWLVIKNTSICAEEKVNNYKRFTTRVGKASALGLHSIGLPPLYYFSLTFHVRTFTYITY